MVPIPTSTLVEALLGEYLRPPLWSGIPSYRAIPGESKVDGVRLGETGSRRAALFPPPPSLKLVGGNRIRSFALAVLKSREGGDQTGGFLYTDAV